MVDSGYADGVIVAENQETLSVMVGEKPNIYSSSKTYNNSIWTDLKPFVNGGLAGLLEKSPQLFSLTWLPLLYRSNSKDPRISALRKKHIPSEQAYNSVYKRLPRSILIEASYTSLQLGSFEILRRKVEAANNGMPLTLFQEACCGLTTGAIATYVWYSFSLAFATIKGDTFQSMFQHLYRTAANEGVLALWKGGQPRANVLAWNMGMLAPYHRCYNYFRESRGLTETRAIIVMRLKLVVSIFLWGGTLCFIQIFTAGKRVFLGPFSLPSISIVRASAVSGFSAAACCYPLIFGKVIMDNMKPDANGKSYNLSLSGGSVVFFIGFFRAVFQITPRVMVLWFLFEKIRKHEESIQMFHRKEREIFTSEWK